MSDFPVNPHGEWSIYSRQIVDPGWVGDIEKHFGWVHTYLALVRADGKEVAEIQGFPSGQFTLGSPVAGDYLKEQMTFPNAYPGEPVVSSKLVASGSQDQMNHLFNTGYNAVQHALSHNQILYVGASLTEPAYNSNSVWYTAMEAMKAEAAKLNYPFKIQDPSLYETYRAPGDNLDLTHAASNLHHTSIIGNAVNEVIGALNNLDNMYAAHPAAVTAAAAGIVGTLLATVSGVVIVKHNHSKKEPEKAPGSAAYPSL